MEYNVYMVEFFALVYLVGHSFINSFFKHKEEMLIKMYEDGEGKANG